MLVKFIISLIPFFIYLWIKSKKSVHMLQQNWYNEGNRYIKWIWKHKKTVFGSFELLFFIFGFGFLLTDVWTMILFVTLYTVLSLILLHQEGKEQNKLPLKFTKRVRRLFVTIFIIYILPIIGMVVLYQAKYVAVYYLIIGLLSYMNYYMIYIANGINYPIEKAIKMGFKRKAVKKLNSMNIKVIGVTGSYGKTSSKNILSDILNMKYNALPTPKNFNTPLGLIITINNHLDKFNDILIAEMGAFKQGEIQELCDLVHPQYGILTKIGTAHLESFGSQKNIQKGKFELIESLPQDGIGVLNADDPLQVSYKLKNNCKIVWIGIENEKADVRATNIELNCDGTAFDVVFKGDKKEYHFTTQLLGQANVYNILAGIALGHEFGMTIEQLQAGVKKVKPVEHRLEMKKMGNINIIDDAYNSNPVGAKMALDTLALMPGKKIVVTPGMIEMGIEQDKLNATFGEQISEVADAVILVGEKQTEPIYKALIKKKYNEKNIYVLNDVKEAFPLMQTLSEKNTYVLLENDLPDIFNER